jgi:hypothetical protein
MMIVSKVLLFDRNAERRSSPLDAARHRDTY